MLELKCFNYENSYGKKLQTKKLCNRGLHVSEALLWKQSFDSVSTQEIINFLFDVTNGLFFVFPSESFFLLGRFSLHGPSACTVLYF